MANSITAIDIGTSSVKLVELDFADGPRITKMELVELEPAADEASLQERQAEAVRGVIRGLDLKNARIISVVEGPMTGAWRIKLPMLPKRELPEAVRWQARKQIPSPPEGVEFAHELKGEILEGGAKKLDVLVGACSNLYINKNFAVLRDAGIWPSMITLPAISLQKLLENVKVAQEGQITAVINIGGTNTDICIFRGEELIFSRQVSVAGQDLTKALTVPIVTEGGEVRLSIDEAETVKKRYGVPAEGEETLADEKLTGFHIRSLMRPALERLVSEIERSFNYCRKEFHRIAIEKVILFGGSAKLKGLTRFLAGALDVEVEAGDVLQNIKLSPEILGTAEKSEAAHRFAVAIGAALSKGRGLNLLPEDLKKKAVQAAMQVYVKGAALLTVFLLVFGYIILTFQFIYYKRRISADNAVLLALTSEFEKAWRLQRIHRESIERKMLMKRLLLAQPRWGEILKEISNIIPEEAYLTRLEAEYGELILSGKITGEEKIAETALSKFMLALEDGIFENVTLISSRKSEKLENVTEFEVSCEVK